MSRVPSTPARRVASTPAVAGFRPAALALAVGLALQAGAHAQSVPIGAVHGTASFQRDGNNLLVTTTNGAGQRSVINWQTFGVPTGSRTWFAQPDAASTSINRVTGGVRSDIFGSLGSNGRLVLVNPSGIAIGANAMVDTAGFTASTLDLGESDAILGRLRFQGGTGEIRVGEGAQILARSGDVVLVGSRVQVERNAVLQAQGATILAAGEKAELTGRGLEGITLEVKAGNEAVNLGTLSAGAVGIFAQTLKHSGLVRAESLGTEGGKVVLRASGGDTLVDGRVIAHTGHKGGSIDLLGDRVALLAGAQVEANGRDGGGSIRIGGDYQGRNPAVPNARAVYVDASAAIRADATRQGDGGRVIVWSDELTRMRGTISARGGAGGGNGGFAEVSSKGHLDYTGMTDLTALQGRVGTLLLDPQDIVIFHTGSADSTATPYTNDYIAIGNTVGGADFTYTGGTSYMEDAKINQQLATSNLTITTSHDPARYPPPGPSSAPVSDSGSGGQITMNADADIYWNTPNKLEFLADKGIAIRGRITGDNAAASLAMTAKNGSIVIDPAATVQTGGDIALNATGDIVFSYLRTGGSSGNGWNAGKVGLTAGGNILGGAIQTEGDYKSGGDAGNGGDVTLKAGGNISLDYVLAYGGNAYELVSTSPTPAPAIPPGRAGNGGAVKIDAGGSITVDSIQTWAGGAYGGSSFPAGGTAGTAGSIDLQANGDIAARYMDVSGGTGTTGSAGGQVTIRKGANLQFHEIQAAGGTSLGSGKAGRGGTVDIAVSGNILMTPYVGGDAVNADGAYGGSAGADGGDGGTVSLKAGGAINVVPEIGEVALSTTGYYDRAYVSANGGDGGSGGGKGGNGGSVRMEAAQPLVMDTSLLVTAWGGDGGDASGSTGGAGGSGGRVDLRSGSTVAPRGAVVLAGGGFGGAGATTGADGALGNFTASGTSVEVEDNFILDGNWTNNSVVNVRGASQVVGSGVFRNASDVNLYDTGYLTMAAVENAGRLRAFGSQVGATLTKNTGLVEVNAGSALNAASFFDNAGALVVNGTLNIGSSAVPPAPVPAPAPAPVPLLAAAVGPGAVFTNQASGTVSGSGTINVDQGTGTVDNFGTLAPGGTGVVGQLRIGGSLVMEAGSTLAADVVNTASYDSVVVSGTAQSGGSVAANYLPGTSFAAGDSFRVLQSAALDAATVPPVDKPELLAQASGNDLLLVAAAPYPAVAPAPPPLGAVQQEAQQQSNNQVTTFLTLFEQLQEEDVHRIGKDDIVVTDTACVR